MIARIRFAFVLYALALLVPTQAVAQHFPSDEELTALIQSRVEEGRAVGIVLGVLEADGSRRIVHAGSAGPDARALGARSLFEIGSITKVLTATLLADMDARGELSLSDPVSAYLPEGVTMPSRDGREITLLDLSTHHSGLPRMPSNFAPADPTNPYADYTVEQMYEFLSGHELRRDIGAEYEYSNLALGLLGHVLELVSGKSYEELVRERILEPLGMDMTDIFLEGELEDWMTQGHNALGLVVPYWGFADAGVQGLAMVGAGALRSNVEDMLKFLAANAGPPESDLERVMRTTHEVRESISDALDIGLNWHIQNYGEKRIIGHGGGTAGFRTYIGFEPDLGVGAVMLTNSAHGAEDIALHLINPDVPLRPGPQPWVDRTELEITSGALGQFVGDYELRPTFSINVTLEGGALFAQATGQGKLPILAESDTVFFYRAVNAQLTFTKDDAGVVDGLILHQNGRDQPAPKRNTPGVPLASADDTVTSLPGTHASIRSEVMGEERALGIVRPDGYNLSLNSIYPVLYVLHGECRLRYADGVVQTLAAGGNLPDMIVVHADINTVAGGDDDVLRFLSDELKPWINTEYRTAPFSAAVGCSDAGLIATRVRGENPESFQASVWVNPGTSVSVFFNTEWNSSNQSPDPHNGLHAGFEWLFEGWNLPGITNLAVQEDLEGWTEIIAHYAELSERFGYRVVPQEDLADDAAGTFAERGSFDETIRLFEMNAEWHSGSARTFNHLGDAFRFRCRREESEANYSKAYDMASEMSYSNVSNYEMELGRIRQEIESGQECTVPGEDRAEVEVALEILETYVGEYVLSASFSMVVTLEDGQLFVQATGQGKIPIFAESETKFFTKVVDAQLSFTKDESGAVTGIILHQNGRDVPGRRVNN